MKQILATLLVLIVGLALGMGLFTTVGATARAGIRLLAHHQTVADEPAQRRSLDVRAKLSCDHERRCAWRIRLGSV